MLKEGRPESRPSEGARVKVLAQSWVNGELAEPEEEHVFHTQRNQARTVWDMIVPLMNLGERCRVEGTLRFDRYHTHLLYMRLCWCVRTVLLAWLQ